MADGTTDYAEKIGDNQQLFSAKSSLHLLLYSHTQYNNDIMIIDEGRLL